MEDDIFSDLIFFSRGIWVALVALVEMVSEMVPGGLSLSEKVEYVKAVFVLLWYSESICVLMI